MRKCLRWSGLIWLLVLGATAPQRDARGQIPDQSGYGGAPKMMVEPTVSTPDFRGMTLSEAQAANILAPAKGTTGKPTPQKIFSVLNTGGPVDGVVDGQTPEPGTKVYPGRGEATLVMKPTQVDVPGLRGMTAAEARLRLSQSSLTLGRVAGDETEQITSQVPLAGASVPLMTAVNVTMASPAAAAGVSGHQRKPKPTILVPPLEGMTQPVASATLTNDHLLATFIGPQNGIVVRQTPEPETKVVEGTRVRVVMGLRREIILIPQHQMTWLPDWMPAWGWFLAGGLILLGTVGAFRHGMKSPPSVITKMVAKPNPSSTRITMITDPQARWTLRLQDKPSVGITAISGENEIKGERKS